MAFVVAVEGYLAEKRWRWRFVWHATAAWQPLVCLLYEAGQQRSRRCRSDSQCAVDVASQYPCKVHCADPIVRHPGCAQDEINRLKRAVDAANDEKTKLLNAVLASPGSWRGGMRIAMRQCVLRGTIAPAIPSRDPAMVYRAGDAIACSS